MLSRNHKVFGDFELQSPRLEAGAHLRSASWNIQAGGAIVSGLLNRKPPNFCYVQDRNRRIPFFKRAFGQKWMRRKVDTLRIPFRN